ncbi:MAG: FAD-dependent oxidoreductase, partial [Bryobacteraceae bacterium]
IDGTYEGDLAAFAGARYRVGRESRAEFNEQHAGVVYQDHETRAFLPGTTGEGDKRIPAYTYSLCLTTDLANSRIISSPPPEYDRRIYLNYIDDWKAGRFGPPRVMKDGVGHFGPFIGTVVRALSAAEIPNRKLDVNINPRVLGFPFGEENYAYPDAGWVEREKISMRIRNMTLGLVYFLQNDPDVPAEHRELARRYHMARDEFTDNDNFPWQLYVREARRIVGRYTMSENDVILGPGLGRPRIHADSIAAGEYPIDSFPSRKREKGQDRVLEGYLFMLDNITRPFQLPYRIMMPETVEGLLVPVAASTTHIAFSTVRLEPTWMALGQAAGVAAHIAITQGRKVSDVPVDTLQRLLLERGQVLTYFKDIDRADPAYAALQYYGTRGFFKDYYAHSRKPLDRGQAAEWLSMVKGGPVAMEDTGNLTRGEMRKYFSSPEREWRDPANRTIRPEDPVLRGEFCRAAYLQKTP